MGKAWKNWISRISFSKYLVFFTVKTAKGKYNMDRRDDNIKFMLISIKLNTNRVILAPMKMHRTSIVN